MGILSKLRKKKKDSVFSFSHLLNDFIPYACHLDTQTIITKNGELLQTIRIIGVAQDKLGSDIDDLRGIIRKAITDNVNSPDFSLWIHTVRRKANLDPSKLFDSIFAQDIHESWCAKNFWREKFINELYITVLHKGESFDIKNQNDLLRSFSFIHQSKKHSTKIDQSLVKLNTVTDAILKTLSSYGAVRLKIVESNGVFRCELVEFLSKLLHLHQTNVVAPVKDLSLCLADGKIAFGNNTFQILHDRKKHFGAMLSIKEYHDFSSALINQLLKTPQEYIVTQALSFIPNAEALKDITHTEYIMNVSKDSELRENCGLKNIIENAKNSPTDFCKQQLTLLIFADDQEKLNSSIVRMYNAISKLGIAIVREDLLAETLYWSQLPGNFNFVKRTSVIATNNIGGYASLHNSPAGNSSSIWGAPITLFRRNDSTPYFFNYHVDKVGHSLIVGNADSAKNVLLNFLLSETSKLSPKVYALCGDSSSQITIKALGGAYYNIKPDSGYFNPLQLDDNGSNRDFLSHFLSLILEIDNAEQMSNIIEAIYKVEKSKRNLNNFAEFCTVPELVAKIADWQNSGKYGKLFTQQVDLLDTETNHMIGFDLSQAFSEGARFYLPLVMYLVYRFNLILDGTPAIFAMANCDNLLAEQSFVSQLADLFTYYTSKNCISLITANAEKFDKCNIDPATIEQIKTKIFMPDKEKTALYAAKLNLSEEIVAKIKDMKLIYRHFMILQDEDYTICEINLDGIDYAIAVLSGKEPAIKIMNEVIAASSEDPSDWLHPFYQKVV